MTEIAAALLIQVIVSLAGVAYNEFVAYKGTTVYNDVVSAAKKVANAISQDDSAYNAFVNANTAKQSSIANSIANSIGYGSRVKYLKGELAKLQRASDNAYDSHSSYQQKLSSASSELSSAAGQVGYGSSTSSTRHSAEATANKYGGDYQSTSYDAEGNIIGGGLKTPNTQANTGSESKVTQPIFKTVPNIIH